MKKDRFAVILLFICASVAAKEHQVELNDNFFFPSILVIQAGDNVRWTNYGFHAHNIVSDDFDYIFRCANGCDSTGGNGDASEGNWSVVVGFHRTSSIDYLCEPHSQFMQGQIIVKEPIEYQTIEISEISGFAPSEITIPKGGAFKVTNTGGNHNFNLSNGQERCAVGCDSDGVEGFFDPTGELWEFYLKLNMVGSYTYKCDNPDHNESGIIHVYDPLIYSNGFEILIP